MLFIAAMLLGALGVIGDLLAAQRTLSQRTFERVRRIELQLGVEPSHYEPGAPVAPHRRQAPRPAPREPIARPWRYERAAAAVPTGNTYDKYGSTNPVVRRLMAGFESTLEDLFARAAPGSVLDVGCGEGVLTAPWAERLGDRPRRRDRPRGPEARRPSGRRGGAPNLEFRGDVGAEHLPFGDGEFDLVAAIEVLEHVPDPERDGRRDGARLQPPPARVGAARAAVARAERRPRRVRAPARQHPGPRQPLSEAGFLAPARHATATVIEVRSPFPWTMVLVSGATDELGHERRGAAARRAAGRREPATSTGDRYASGRAILSIGIASTGIFTFAYLATASHVLSQDDYGRMSLLLGGHVRDPVGDLPADRAAALAHDRRPPRPRAARPLAAGPGDDPAQFALLFLVVALALRHRSSKRLFDGSSALYWILVVGVLAYAGSYFARGWLAGHQRFALYGGLVFLESTSRFLFALAVAVGIASGQGGGRRSGWRSRRSCRCA